MSHDDDGRRDGGATYGKESAHVNAQRAAPAVSWRVLERDLLLALAWGNCAATSTTLVT